MIVGMIGQQTSLAGNDAKSIVSSQEREGANVRGCKLGFNAEGGGQLNGIVGSQWILMHQFGG